MKKVIISILLMALICTIFNSIVIATAEAEETATVAESTARISFTLDLTSIILSIMGILFAIIMKYLIPLIQTERGRKLAKVAVSAAEQLFQTGVITDRLQYAEDYLKNHGIKVDTRALVEAAVSELNLYKREIDYQNDLQNPPDIDVCDEVDGCSECSIDKVIYTEVETDQADEG